MAKNEMMQKALEYSVYEQILVAAWDCGNNITEGSIFKVEQLYLNAADISDQKRKELDRLAGRLMEGLKKKVSVRMLHSFDRITIVRANDAYHEIRLSGENAVVRIMVDYKGRESRLISECWKK